MLGALSLSVMVTASALSGFQILIEMLAIIPSMMRIFYPLAGLARVIRYIMKIVSLIGLRMWYITFLALLTHAPDPPMWLSITRVAQLLL